jgi:hypothetical protein
MAISALSTAVAVAQSDQPVRRERVRTGQPLSPGADGGSAAAPAARLPRTDVLDLRDRLLEAEAEPATAAATAPGVRAAPPPNQGIVCEAGCYGAVGAVVYRAPEAADPIIKVAAVATDDSQEVVCIAGCYAEPAWTPRGHYRALTPPRRLVVADARPELVHEGSRVRPSAPRKLAAAHKPTRSAARKVAAVAPVLTAMVWGPRVEAAEAEVRRPIKRVRVAKAVRASLAPAHTAIVAKAPRKVRVAKAPPRSALRIKGVGLAPAAVARSQPPPVPVKPATPRPVAIQPDENAPALPAVTVATAVVRPADETKPVNAVPPAIVDRARQAVKDPLARRQLVRASNDWFNRINRERARKAAESTER